VTTLSHPFAVSQRLKCAHSAGNLVVAVQQRGCDPQETVDGKAVGDPHDIASQAETVMQDHHARPRPVPVDVPEYAGTGPAGAGYVVLVFDMVGIVVPTSRHRRVSAQTR
jgi:hypothetical protein